MPDSVPRKKVAIVGTGSAGIAALWALNRSPHDVYVFEAADRLGGHTNTVAWARDKYCTKVDAGFIVMNTATYPNFINFLKKINVPTAKTDMTFSVSRDKGAFEWAGTSLNTLFVQRRNFVSPRMWRILFDILRFNQFAIDVLGGKTGPTPEAEAESIGHYLDREGYSNAFRDDYLLPMTAAVWSTPPEQCALEFPVVTLVRFLWNHHLLSTLSRRPEWLTIPSGAKSYIDFVTRGFPPNHLLLNTPVQTLSNQPDGTVRLEFEGGLSDVFDHVILATHGDVAYDIISATATQEEKQILGSFQTSENVAVLHSDTSLLPASPKAWSSWNYLSLTKSPSSTAAPSALPSASSNIDQVSLTYNMNLLQHIPKSTFGDVLVTLNPLSEPAASTVQGRYTYRHPVYTASTVKAQKLLPTIQNTRGISYAGAWTKYGFHEDGFTSGLEVATKHLGAKVPFELVDSTYSRGEAPKIGIIEWILRLILLFIQIFFIGVFDKVYGVASKIVKRKPAKLAKAKAAAARVLPAPKTNGTSSLLKAKVKEVKAA